MDSKEYQELAKLTLVSVSKHDTLALCGLGLSGEVGEVTDILKKHLFHKKGTDLDVEKLKDEMGDILWYFAILANTVGLSIEEIMQHNINKLAKRHGDKFQSFYASDSVSNPLPAGYSLQHECNKIFVLQNGDRIRTPEGYDKFFRGPNAEKNAINFCWRHAEGYRETSKA